MPHALAAAARPPGPSAGPTALQTPQSGEEVPGTLGDWFLAVGGATDFQTKLVLSVLAVFAILILRRLVLRIADRQLVEPRARYQWSKISAYLAFILAILVVGQIWLEGLRTLGTFLGLLSAGLAIALRDVVANLAGWFFIIWRRPFVVGDRVQVGENSGDVVDVRIFQFTILEIGNWVDADQSTGRIIHIPNATVFSHAIANYTASFEYLWHEIPVLITFESDWRKAKRILEEIVQAQAGDLAEEARLSMRSSRHRLLIFYKTFTPTVYTAVKESGVLLTMRYLCLPRTRRGTTQAIWESVLESFAAEDAIDLAYPTHRVYHNLLEGKEGARAPLPPFAGG
jgi:small-conductance mechanosensitive channel